ncbi:transmembrane protein, putative (macronuclear) [Tetrahymena thermophila SB210]|uniref:Transmembrane protein, putative n=1 Tax=Tetrahymena thermophila (strain SB210) TaxID=312017 RepID=Q24IJ9_TETTS|nr:transmembrane protein, putative [Tetrahymena thermophila SB210]EAS07626.2 transmembrane protein, putative [Tetrahymena thermophila SB210]|eukprot:XP_001027868.2 transmembrane protein, putative [Tetrahymena thermophila SB210]
MKNLFKQLLCIKNYIIGNQLFNFKSSLINNLKNFRNLDFQSNFVLKQDIEADQITLKMREENIFANHSLKLIDRGTRYRTSIRRTYTNQDISDVYISQDIIIKGKEVQYEKVLVSQVGQFFIFISSSAGFMIMIYYLCSQFYESYMYHYNILDTINANFEIPSNLLREDDKRKGEYKIEKDISEIHINIKENKSKAQHEQQLYKIGYFQYCLKYFFISIIGKYKKIQLNEMSKFQYFNQAKAKILQQLTFSQMILQANQQYKIKQLIFNNEQNQIFNTLNKIKLEGDEKRNFQISYVNQADSQFADYKKPIMQNQNKTINSSIENNNFCQKSNFRHLQLSKLNEWKDLFALFIDQKLQDEVNKLSNQFMNKNQKFSKDASLINFVHYEIDKKQIPTNDNSPVKIRQPSYNKRDFNQPRRSLIESPSNFISNNRFSSTIFNMTSKSPTSKQELFKDSSPKSIIKQRRRTNQLQGFQKEQQFINSVNINSPKNINIDFNQHFQQFKQQSIQSPNQLHLKLSKAINTEENQQESTQSKNQSQNQFDINTCQEIQQDKTKANQTNASQLNFQVHEFNQMIQSEKEYINENENQNDIINQDKNQQDANKSIDRRSSTSNVLVDFTTYQQFIINDMIKQQQMQEQIYSKKRSNSLNFHGVSPITKKSTQRNCIQDDQQVDLIISLNCISPQGKKNKHNTSPNRSSDENLHCDKQTIDSHNNQLQLSERIDQKKDNLICIFDESKRSNSPSKNDFKNPIECKKEISNLLLSSQNCSEAEVLEKNKRITFENTQPQYFIHSLNDIQENIIFNNLDETNQDQVVNKNQFLKSYVFSPSIKLQSLYLKSQETEKNSDLGKI